MFQRKIDELFTDFPNKFGTADDILVAKDGTYHDTSLCTVFQICRKETLNSKKINAFSGALFFHSLERLFSGKT